jgi:tetratricopeptide (TPR) repeat protein
MFATIHIWTQDWVRTREWRGIWLGLPALAACIAACVLVALYAANNAASGNSVQHYQAIAVSALTATNYDAARVACLRGMALGGTEKVRSEWLYYLSLAVGGKGHKKESADLLNAAAPLDRRGSPLAHLAAARDLLTATEPEAQTIGLAERHLQIVLLSDPQSVEANEMLGRLYINTGQWEKAEKYLKQALPMKSELALLLAVATQGRGDSYSANNWANAAVATFTGDLKRDAPRENPEDRIGWAQALMVVKDYQGALAVLNEGLNQSGSPIYRRPIADLCAAWAGEHANERAGAAKLINRGLECMPQHPGLLKLLIDASHLAGAEGQSAHSTLNRLLAQGEPPALLHFLLGNDAWQRGHIAEAKTQMSLAFKAAPQMPYVANNMAMLLASDTPPDLERALATIDTRGKILLKLGRYQDAITDLEFALPWLQAPESTHKALAQAYQPLGLAQLAQEHLRLAEAPSERSASVSATAR